MMAAEETPEAYLAELRALAKRPDAQLIPQARFVIVGTAVAETAAVTAGTRFREGLVESVRSEPHPVTYALRPGGGAPTYAAATPRTYTRPDTQVELPAVEPPRPPATAAGDPKGAPPTDPAQVARNAFGLTTPRHGVPSVSGDDADEAFGRTDEAAAAAAEFGWEWEKPEGS
jgi:hypothetical protein